MSEHKLVPWWLGPLSALAWVEGGVLIAAALHLHGGDLWLFGAGECLWLVGVMGIAQMASKLTAAPSKGRELGEP